MMYIQKLLEKYRLAPWIVCLSAALFFFYEFMQMNLMNSMSEFFLHRYSLDPGQLGIFSATYFYANALLLIPAGLLLDRYSVRRSILLAASFCVFGTALLLVSTNVWIAVFGRLITGASNAFALLGCLKLASRWLSTRYIALATGIIVAIGIFGGVLSQMPFALMVTAYGLKFALKIDVLIGSIMLCILYCCVWDGKTIHPGSASFRKAWRLTASNSVNWFLGLYAGFVNLPLAVLGGLWGDVYLTKIFFFTATQSAAVSTCLFLGMMIGSPVMGAISGHYRKPESMMAWGASVLSLLLLPFILANSLSFAIAILLFFLIGFFSGSQVISYGSIVENNSVLATSTSMALASVLIMLSSGVFQPLFGWVAKMHSEGEVFNILFLKFSMGILFFMILLGIVMIIIVRKKLKHFHYRGKATAE